MHISICICSYKRPELLRRLLRYLLDQKTGGLFTYSIVVADNDEQESARPVISEFELLLPIVYCVEPEPNIASARNRAVANAKGDWIALIDDDEFPGQEWLFTLFTNGQRHGVDGVLGPVRPMFESPPPRWLIRGGFCERPEHPTGMALNWRQTRTGNVLFKRAILDHGHEAFSRTFGNGGEDSDFFRRMIEEGRVFIWCNEAVVWESVPAERLKRSYFLKRALLQGQNQSHFADLPGILKSLVALPVYLLLLPLMLVKGQHAVMNLLIKATSHFGQIAALIGFKPMGNNYLTRKKTALVISH